MNIHYFGVCLCWCLPGLHFVTLCKVKVIFCVLVEYLNYCLVFVGLIMFMVPASNPYCGVCDCFM